jgi:hypothetical protein
MTREKALKELSRLLAENSKYGIALRGDVANAVHRQAVLQLTAGRATEFQAISEALRKV